MHEPVPDRVVTYARGRAHLAAAVLAAVLAVVGCSRFGSSSSSTTVTTPVTLPCATAASSTDNLRPSQDRPPAEFTTDGSPIYVTVSGYEHAQAFDPKVGRSTVYVGHVERPPTFDAQRNIVTNVVRQIEAEENRPALLDLEPGRYWLWASNAPDLRLEGCGPKSVTEAKPGA